MPRYRYKCTDCNTHVELSQKMSERKPPSECQNCGCKTFTQVITAPMFVLKGRGWANDGYNYAKTPADTIPGYSDQDRQVILPNRKTDATPPSPVDAPLISVDD